MAEKIHSRIDEEPPFPSSADCLISALRSLRTRGRLADLVTVTRYESLVTAFNTGSFPCSLSINYSPTL